VLEQVSAVSSQLWDSTTPSPRWVEWYSYTSQEQLDIVEQYSPTPSNAFVSSEAMLPSQKRMVRVLVDCDLPQMYPVQQHNIPSTTLDYALPLQQVRKLPYHLRLRGETPFLIY